MENETIQDIVWHFCGQLLIKGLYGGNKIIMAHYTLRQWPSQQITLILSSCKFLSIQTIVHTVTDSHVCTNVCPFVLNALYHEFYVLVCVLQCIMSALC